MMSEGIFSFPKIFAGNTIKILENSFISFKRLFAKQINYQVFLHIF